MAKPTPEKFYLPIQSPLTEAYVVAYKSGARLSFLKKLLGIHELPVICEFQSTQRWYTIPKSMDRWAQGLIIAPEGLIMGMILDTSQHPILPEHKSEIEKVRIRTSKGCKSVEVVRLHVLPDIRNETAVK